MVKVKVGYHNRFNIRKIGPEPAQLVGEGV